MDALNWREEDGNQYWTFQEFAGHRKDPSNPDCWEGKVSWYIGYETWEPVPVIRKDDPWNVKVCIGEKLHQNQRVEVGQKVNEACHMFCKPDCWNQLT